MLVSRRTLYPQVLPLFFLLSLAGCSSVAIDTSLLQYAHLPLKHSLDSTPYFPQIEDQCGPASLATLLVANGIDVDPEQLRGKIYIPGKQGAVTTEMIARARKYGLLVYQLAPKIEDVLSEIAAGNPVLVMQNLGFAWLPRWHFSVAMGFDLERKIISLRSGHEKKHDVPIRLFMKTWERADQWAIVVTQPDRLPATAIPESVILSASQLEQVGEVNTAFIAYQAILERWPEEAPAAFGAGNTAYALEYFSLAHDFYLRYLALKPNAQEGWNNLAYSLHQQGCHQLAMQAINCALKIDPQDNNIQQSAIDIGANQHNEDQNVKHCPTLMRCP